LFAALRESVVGPERRVQRLTTSVAIGEERTWLDLLLASSRSKMTRSVNLLRDFGATQQVRSAANVRLLNPQADSQMLVVLHRDKRCVPFYAHLWGAVPSRRLACRAFF
jgi:hypothetical protein